MTQASRSLSFGDTSRLGLLLAGALAVVAGVLVFVAIQHSDSGSTSTPSNVTGGSETVVVTAKQDIDARTENHGRHAPAHARAFELTLAGALNSCGPRGGPRRTHPRL